MVRNVLSVVILSTICACTFVSVASAADEIDIAAIKKETLKALPEKDREKADLSYITEDFVKKALKDVKKAEKGFVDETGKEAKEKKQESKEAKAYIGNGYGNHYFINSGVVYWKYGDAGTTESYSCGQKYTRSVAGATISVAGNCNGGYVYYRFDY